MLRQHKKFNHNFYELLNNLEEDFTNLMSFDSYLSFGEYETLLNETLQIGIDIHKEVKNMQKNNQ